MVISSTIFVLRIQNVSLPTFQILKLCHTQTCLSCPIQYEYASHYAFGLNYCDILDFETNQQLRPFSLLGLATNKIGVTKNYTIILHSGAYGVSSPQAITVDIYS